MKIVECNDYREVSVAAAKIVAEQVKLKPNSVLGLPTGSTPVGMYEELIRLNKSNDIDFSKVITFNLDEYYPISRENNQSYYYFMHEKLFNHININKNNVHILNGETDNPNLECDMYEEMIKKSGGIDLQVLGIGQNGHIGFNEPGESLQSTTHMITLTQNTIDANSRFFENVKDVPTKSLTMGISTIMKAKKIIVLASGESKAEAVKSLFSGEITTQNPSTILNAHSDVTLILDKSVL